MEQSTDITELAKAMAKFRADVKQPSKTGDGHFGDYVELEGVINAIDVTASDNGLSYVQEATSSETVVNVTTQIMHSSGQWIRLSPMSIPASRKDAQQFGSAETYARRYALSAAFGISSDKDDDGQVATDNAPKQSTSRSNAKADTAQQPKRTKAQADYAAAFSKLKKMLGEKRAKEIQLSALGMASVAPGEKPTDTQLIEATKTLQENYETESAKQKQEATA